MTANYTYYNNGLSVLTFIEICVTIGGTFEANVDFH